MAVGLNVYPFNDFERSGNRGIRRPSFDGSWEVVVRITRITTEGDLLGLQD